MSLASAQTERERFGYLLQLSQEMVRALERNDKHAFNRILAARQTVIDGFRDARSLVASDPAIARTVVHIQDCERTAERLMYRKMGSIMRLLSELQQSQKARTAYGRGQKISTQSSRAYTADTPKFIDQKT